MIIWMTEYKHFYNQGLFGCSNCSLNWAPVLSVQIQVLTRFQTLFFKTGQKTGVTHVFIILSGQAINIYLKYTHMNID